MRVDVINQAVVRIARELEQRSTSFQWTDLTEQDLWHELVGCILSSRTRFEIAHAASMRLRDKGLLDAPIRSRFSDYERALRKQLSLPITSGSSTCLYPYASKRANWLRRSAEVLYGSGGSIREFLTQSGDALRIRSELVKRLAGIGPKQASLFLHNIGFAADLAILDSHVLRYLAINSLIRRDISVSTLSCYEPVEATFRLHARDQGFSMRSLDLGVWIVMRVLGQRR